MQEALNRHAGALALAALIVSVVGAGIVGAGAAGLLVTGKQIKNGSITAKDLRRNSVHSKAIDKGAVKTTDIGTGQVQSADIGDDQVTPRSLSLPAPMQVVVAPQVAGPVGPDFGPLASIGTYNKASAASVVKVEWSGVATSGEYTNCVFQIRVNGLPAAGGGGEVFAFEPVNVSTSAIFAGLPAGPAQVEVWSRYSGLAGPAGSCVISPAYPGLSSTFVVSEDFT